MCSAEGLELDAVSAGEVALALAAGLPASAIHLHGNFKPQAELAAALGVGPQYHIVLVIDRAGWPTSR